MTTIEKLQQVKEHLIVNGWTQHNIYGNDGSACLVGAIRLVTGHHIDNSSSLDSWETGPGLKSRELITILETMAGVDNHHLSNWNDQKTRTFNDVMDLIDLAILSEKEKNQDGI